MQEELICYQTGLLAKLKGFDVECRYYFDYDKFKEKPVAFFGKLNANGLTKLSKKGEIISAKLTSAPTQSLLQKWLREVHEIEVNPAQNFTKGGIKMQYNISIESYKYNHLGKYIYGNTYEEVLEVGLQEALNLIP